MICRMRKTHIFFNKYLKLAKERKFTRHSDVLRVYIMQPLHAVTLLIRLYTHDYYKYYSSNLLSCSFPLD